MIWQLPHAAENAPGGRDNRFLLHEVPDDAVAHLARQVRVPATELRSFDFASRTAKRHRTEIRAYTGFRECSVADAEALAGWLAEHVASGERRPERVRDELILRCRAELIEPPTPERVSEIARSALHQAEQALLALIADRLDPVVVARLEALIAVSDDDEDENVLGLIKAAPGNVSLETMLVEISKLEAIRAIGLPAGLFDGIDARIIAGWRARAAVESPVHVREHPSATGIPNRGRGMVWSACAWHRPKACFRRFPAADAAISRAGGTESRARRTVRTVWRGWRWARAIR